LPSHPEEPPPPFEELQRLVRLFCAHYAPHAPPRTLEIILADGDRLRLPVAPTPKDGQAPRRHSEDYRYVWWTFNGESIPREYQFNSAQAAAVRALWAGWEQGAPDVQGAALCEAAESEGSRARDLFKAPGGVHCGWGELIQPGHLRGTYRLAESLPGD